MLEKLTHVLIFTHLLLLEQIHSFHDFQLFCMLLYVQVHYNYYCFFINNVKLPKMVGPIKTHKEILLPKNYIIDKYLKQSDNRRLG